MSSSDLLRMVEEVAAEDENKLQEGFEAYDGCGGKSNLASYLCYFKKLLNFNFKNIRMNVPPLLTSTSADVTMHLISLPLSIRRRLEIAQW